METKVSMNPKSHWGMAMRGCSQRRRAGQDHGCKSVPEPSSGKPLLAQSLLPQPEPKQGHLQPLSRNCSFSHTHRSPCPSPSTREAAFSGLFFSTSGDPGQPCCHLRQRLMIYYIFPGQQTWTSPPAHPTLLERSSPTTEHAFPRTASLPYLG